MTDEPQTTPAESTSLPNAKQSRRILLIAGVVLLLFALYLLVFLVPDFLKSVAGPERMTLAHAAEVATSDSTYAMIDDQGTWHCDTIDYIRGVSSTNRRRIITRNTEIFLTDASDKVVVLVTGSGEMSCEDFENNELSGYLTRMSSSKQQELTDEIRLAQFYDATDYLEFCDYCGPENSLIGVIVGMVFAAGGGALLYVRTRIPKPPTDDAA